MTVAIVVVVSFVITFLGTPVCIVAARHSGTMDEPGALKPQSRSVPYLGGVAVFIGLLVGVAVGRPSLVFPLLAATILGVADDRFDLSANLRIVGQLVVGALVVVTCPVHLSGVVAAIVLVAVTVVLINGVNLLDGLDLLAGGVTALAAFAFAFLLHGSGRDLGVALGSALLAFLLYNRPPARIYLGDGGSYLLGTALAIMLAGAWAPGVPASRAVAALALVIVPTAEIFLAVVRRVRGRRALFSGDRGHPYDRLVSMGWRPLFASLAYIATEAILAVSAVLAGVKLSLTASVIVVVAGAVVVLVAAAATGAFLPEEETTT
jgi:UDP-GlcNAc:undecaprenyl-phosphate/decaprenyl-phosphate GlcNAc-1-phosphate transferase